MVFEFVIATVLFIGIIFFVILMVGGEVSSYSGGYYSNHVASEAMRASELLTHSKGMWSGKSLVQPGFALDWPVADDAKIARVLEYCANNKGSFASLFDLGNRTYDAGIIIRVSNSTQLLGNCSTGPSYSEQAYAERFMHSPQSGIIKIGVYVW